MDVNKAWDKLHTRLVEEQLLNRNAKTVVVPFVTKMKWAAAIIVLCVIGSAIGLYLNFESESISFVSIHNDDKASTLVKILDDGSIVFLNGGATLTFPEQFAADKRKVSMQGDALFDVQSNADSPFFIETESVMVEVLGTKFNVKTSGKESFELSVQQGIVKVTLKATGDQTFVEAGETVHLEERRQQLLKTSSDNWKQFARYAEKMQFKDERLENIVYTINKMSVKPIHINDDALKSRGITIPFKDNTVEEMVELICTVLDLKYTDDGKEIVIGNW